MCAVALRAGLALSIAFIVTVGAGAASGASRRQSCAHAGRTVAANPAYRFFWIGKRIHDPRDDRGTVVAREYYGCQRSRARLFHISEAITGLEYVSHPTLAGRFVAFESAGIDSFEATLEVFDLRTGDLTYENDSLPEGLFPADLEVTPGGALAWLSYTASGIRVAVVKRDANGQAQIGEVDETNTCPSHDYCHNSLTRRGSAILWIQDGQQRSYRLVGQARG